MFKGLLITLLAAVPTSTNYTLETYDFGNGAGSPTSSNYQLKASVGAPGDTLSSTNYGLPAGIRASATAATPSAPTFANPDNSYNRLKVTLNTSGLPSDTKYLIAISDNNFVSTQYVQLDQTVGSSAAIANYQTYAAWGGASGFWILGLNPATTYKVKVAAWRGGGTGSLFGPTATAATVSPSVTLGLSTSLTSTPPFNVDFSSLTAGSVVTANATVIATLTTNAQNGGALLLKGQNGGLASALSSYTITSATADLTAAATGYGARVSGVSQDSGGPFVTVSPFDGSGNNVGAISNTWQQLVSFASPITNGNATTELKAKSDSTVPAGADYADVLTLSASLLF